MGAFEYQALDAGNKTARGVIQADTARAARAQLRERGLFPIDIQSVEATSKSEFSFRSQGRERALLLRQLATLLRAGLTLEEVLSVLVEQTDSSGPNAVHYTVPFVLRVMMKRPGVFRPAMAEHPALFPPTLQRNRCRPESAPAINTIRRTVPVPPGRITPSTRRDRAPPSIRPGPLIFIPCRFFFFYFFCWPLNCPIAAGLGLTALVVPRVKSAVIRPRRPGTADDHSAVCLAFSDLVSNVWSVAAVFGIALMAVALARGTRQAPDRDMETFCIASC